MNYGDITNEVEKALARNDSDVTTRIAGWVNRAQRDAARRYNFNFMRARTTISIVDGTQSYSLPSDYKSYISVRLQKTSEWVDLDPLGENLARSKHTPDGTGDPSGFTIRDTSLLVWPQDPNAAFTLELIYWKWPADLSGTQTNWFTDNAPDMLIAGGVQKGYEFLGAQEDAVYWRARFQEEFVSSVAADEQPDEDRLSFAGLGVDYRPAETSVGVEENED